MSTKRVKFNELSFKFNKSSKTTTYHLSKLNAVEGLFAIRDDRTYLGMFSPTDEVLDEVSAFFAENKNSDKTLIYKELGVTTFPHKDTGEEISIMKLNIIGIE